MLQSGVSFLTMNFQDGSIKDDEKRRFFFLKGSLYNMKYTKQNFLGQSVVMGEGAGRQWLRKRRS